uniref:Reverse transcriptase zinc-binding domain-containing protein n=1 Tax=Opuntia streptacantha TaxID=393608 RepID=A0A7C8ZND3_OPUST
MPKIKIFLWQMCHNALPVRETLLRRGCHIDPQCPLCLTEIKTTDHLFGDCPQTIRPWNVAQLHNWIPHIRSRLNPMIGCLFSRRSLIRVMGKYFSVFPSYYGVYGTCEMLLFSNRRCFSLSNVFFGQKN